MLFARDESGRGSGGRTYSGANQRTGAASRQRTDAGTRSGAAAYEGKISLFVRSADPGIRAGRNTVSHPVHAERL
jgi:hypothetical protein